MCVKCDTISWGAETIICFHSRNLLARFCPFFYTVYQVLFLSDFTSVSINGSLSTYLAKPFLVKLLKVKSQFLLFTSSLKVFKKSSKWLKCCFWISKRPHVPNRKYTLKNHENYKEKGIILSILTVSFLSVSFLRKNK